MLNNRFEVEEISQRNITYGIHDKKTGVVIMPKFGTLDEAEKICRILNIKNRIKGKI